MAAAHELTELPHTSMSTVADKQPHSLPKYLQEIEQTQEFRDLVASLPTEKGWVENYLHQYQGFWHTTRQLKGVIACQRHFQAQKSDVLLVSTPKSGTTWLKAIMFALLNRARFPDPKQHPLLTSNPHELVPFMEYEYIDASSSSSSSSSPSPSPSLPYDSTSSFDSPRLLSTHLPFVSLPKSVEDSGCKIVYLCRNPKDTFVSLWHFTNKLKPKDKGDNSLTETFDKFCRGVSLHGPFWDHALGYWKASLENPERVLFLKYEEMKREPKAQLRKISQLLGCPFSQEEDTNDVMLDEILQLCSIDNLQNLEVNKIGKLSFGEENQAFFRRGEINDFVNYLTDEMSKQIDWITELEFSDYGLTLS